MLLTEGVGSSSGVRASIHNGFWVWKLLVLAFLCVTTFVIPVVFSSIKLARTK